MPGKQENWLGVAIAKRTGECRIMRVDAYLELDESSEARWEFHAFELDPRTGEPTAAELERFGFTPGGPIVLPGFAVEVSPGFFRDREPTEAN